MTFAPSKSPTGAGRDFAIVFAILCVAFSPVLWFAFAYHNDLGFWYGPPGSGYFESGHLILVGRPIGALLLNLQKYVSGMFSTVRILTFWRLLALVCVAITGTLLGRIVRENTSLSQTQRRCFVLVTLLQPSWLLAVTWTANLVPGSMSYVAALLAALEFDRLRKTSTLKSSRLILPVILLSLSIYTYPPGAVTFFWLELITLAFGRDRYTARRLAGTVGFFGGIALFCISLHLLGIQPVLCGANKCQTWLGNDHTSYVLTPASDPLTKLQVLLDSLTTTFASWSNFAFRPLAHRALGLVSAGVIGVAAYGISARQKKLVGTPAVLSAVGIVTILLALNSGNLISQFSILAFRTVAPNTIFIGVIVILASVLLKSNRVRNGALIAASAVCALAAVATAYHFTSYYGKAWQTITEKTRSGYQCDRDERGLALQGDEKMKLFFGAQQSAVALNDFGYEVFVPWTLAGRCKVITGT